MKIWHYHEFNRGVHDHRSRRRPAVPKHPGSAGARPRCGRGRCRRTPGRQGREHPPGLRLRLATVPKVGRGRRTPGTARGPAGRGLLPRPPDLNRPVHRHRPAGPLGHLPFSRRRRDGEGRQPRPPPDGVRGGQGVAQPGSGSQAGRRPHRRRPGPGPRGPPPAQAQAVADQDGISGDRPASVPPWTWPS